MSASEPTKIETGVPGLDDILQGGIQPGRSYLVEGTPGTGKTTLSLQFLLSGAQAGETCLYITLSESEPELQAVARSHGWSLAGLDVFELITDEGLSLEQEQSVLHPAELELGETTHAVIDRVRTSNPSRVVFDSLSELRLLAQNPLRYRRQILALKQFFGQIGCTVLFLDDRSSASDLQLHSIVHGVVMLEQVLLDFGAERRRLRVMKMRGSAFRGGWHDYTIRRGGLVAFPRLVASEHSAGFAPDLLGSGTAGLDTLLGGGLAPGTNVLLSGPAGTGKTTTAITMVDAALKRGQRAIYFLFDETLPTLMMRSASLGIDLAPAMQSGQLVLRQIDPAEISPGEFTSLIRHAVEHQGCGLVVLDSLNAFMQSMPGEQFLLLQMHELSSYLNQRGVLTIMVLSMHGVAGDLRNSVDLSYLADTVVLLRFFEVEGAVRKAISVIKTRTTRHEPTIREFMIGRAGLKVGPPLRGFRGVLTGTPTWQGEQTELLALEAGGAEQPAAV